MPERKSEEEMGLVRRIKLFFDRKSRGYTENPIVLWLLAVSFISNLSNWAALKIFIKPIDENIILHYNVYFGVDLEGRSWQAYFFPLAGLFILIFNLVLGAFFFKNRERVASYILLMAALMANLSLLIASTSVIIINY